MDLHSCHGIVTRVLCNCQRKPTGREICVRVRVGGDVSVKDAVASQLCKLLNIGLIMEFAVSELL